MPPEGQEHVAHSSNDITDEEWKIIEDRSSRYDNAGDDEVKRLFDKY